MSADGLTVISPITEEQWRRMPHTARLRMLNNVNQIIRALNADERTVDLVAEQRAAAEIRAEAVQARRDMLEAYAERDRLREETRQLRAEHEHTIRSITQAEDLLVEDSRIAARRRLNDATREAEGHVARQRGRTLGKIA
jgi:hypothetical protein